MDTNRWQREDRVLHDEGHEKTVVGAPWGTPNPVRREDRAGGELPWQRTNRCKVLQLSSSVELESRREDWGVQALRWEPQRPVRITRHLPGRGCLGDLRAEARNLGLNLKASKETLANCDYHWLLRGRCKLLQATTGPQSIPCSLAWPITVIPCSWCLPHGHK